MLEDHHTPRIHCKRPGGFCGSFIPLPSFGLCLEVPVGRGLGRNQPRDPVMKVLVPAVTRRGAIHGGGWGAQLLHSLGD